MKRFSLLVIAAFFAVVSFAQNIEQSQGQASRIEGLDKKYTLNKEAKLFLDSVKNFKLSSVSFTPISRSKVLVKDSLLVAQDIFVASAKVMRDSATKTYAEVLEWKVVTAIVSEADEKGSFKEYTDNIKRLKKEAADKLRKQLSELEKD